MEKKKIKIFVAIFSFIGILIGTILLYQTAKTQATYSGLPTVPCLDATKPLIQNYSLVITIYVNNKKYPLDPSIGHDAGDCLHSIFTNDSSGTVYVKSNNTYPLTLGEFFDTWKKTFTKNQMFDYQATHPIKVLVNNKSVNTYRGTILKSGEKIDIVYNE